MKKIFSSFKVKHLLRKAAAKFIEEKYPEAINLYKEALQLDPNNFESRLWLGSAYIETKQFSRAIQHLEKANTLKPNRFEPYYQLGILEESLGKFGQAINTFQKVINRCKIGNDRKAEIYGNIAELKLRSRLFEDAIEYGNQALQLYPTYPKVEQIILHAYTMIKERDAN